MNKVICGGFNVGRGLRANGKILELLNRIPPITDEDEGNILGVVDGKLAWIDSKSALTFTAVEAGSTVAIQKVIGDSTKATPIDVNLKYSIDDGFTWNTFAYDTPITLTNVGDKITIKGNNPNGLNYVAGTTGIRVTNYNRFVLTGKIKCSGDVISLISDEMSVTDLSNIEYCFLGLFREQTALVKAPSIGATKLGNYCYNNMFRDCSALAIAPKLSATELANNCYTTMFQNCTSLLAAPKLPATIMKESCYNSMFRGCTALTAAPELPAIVLANTCYTNMFYGCSAITVAPELPSVTLMQGCYANMFQNCTALVNAPELPATALVNSCYANMFDGCTSLSKIKVNFEEWNPTDATTSWVRNVPSTGTFYCSSALPQDFGITKIPTGWTVVNI